MAAGAVYTELATSPSNSAALAADAAWSDFDPADILLDEAEPSDFDLDIDWELVDG